MLQLIPEREPPVRALTSTTCLALVMMANGVFASASLPVWELGVGAFAINGQDYPASDRANNRVLVAPFGVYRSDRFRLGEGGLQAIAVENPRYRFDISVSGSLNANSEGNPLREGMPDLDFLFEIGPQLVVTLDRDQFADKSESTTELAVQLRGAFSTDFGSVSSLGPVASLALEYERENMLDGKLDLGVEFNAVFAGEDMHDLFYQVDAEFATATRPTYDAESGYLGSDISFSGSYAMTPDIVVFSGISWNSYKDAANENSPLFETDSTVNSWLGLLWRLRESSRRITVLR